MLYGGGMNMTDGKKDTKMCKVVIFADFIHQILQSVNQEHVINRWSPNFIF